MENASKALIIAGAILLSILIIGLGMAVYNNASSTTGKSDLSAQEISAHNATFEAYEGRIKGQQVRTLMNMIRKNNDEYEDRQIEFDAETAGGTFTNPNYTNQIKGSTTYKVSFVYDGNDGLISKCIVRVYGN